VPIELGLTPDAGWQAEVAELLAVTAAAGFTTTGIGEARVDAELVTLLDANGLRCHELMALLVSDDRDTTVTAAQSLAEAAGIVHAEWVLTVFRSPLDATTAPIIERCAAMFAEAGSKMAVEFSPMGGVTSIEAGLAVVDAAGAGRAGLLIDTWHFSRGDSTWEQLATIPLDAIAYVQFTDALPAISEKPYRETTNRRALPGDGELELERFASTLRDRGWEGLVSVEVLNAELRELPVEAFVGSLYESTARYWL
jgi:sugar phosphate isomerase/epimerase